MNDEHKHNALLALADNHTAVEATLVGAYVRARLSNAAVFKTQWGWELRNIRHSHEDLYRVEFTTRSVFRVEVSGRLELEIQ